MSNQYLGRTHHLGSFNSGYTMASPHPSHRGQTAAQVQVDLAPAPGFLAAFRVSSKTRTSIKPALRPEAHAAVGNQIFLVVVTAIRPASSGDSTIYFSLVSREAPNDGQVFPITGCPGYDGFKIWTAATYSAYLQASAQILSVGPQIEEVQHAALKASPTMCPPHEVFVELLPLDTEVAHRASSPTNYAKLIQLILSCEFCSHLRFCLHDQRALRIRTERRIQSPRTEAAGLPTSPSWLTAFPLPERLFSCLYYICIRLLVLFFQWHIIFMSQSPSCIHFVCSISNQFLHISSLRSVHTSRFGVIPTDANLQRQRAAIIFACREPL